MSFSQSPLLLGFDARENSMSFGQTWDRDRRHQYLFAERLTKPLSVDPYVWPTVLDQSSESQNSGLNNPLYNDLDELVCQLEKHDVEDCCVVALACFEPDRCCNDQKWPYKVVTEPPRYDASWMFLGFDIVADQSLLSGLMNCGFNDSERAFAVKEWSKELNDHHLFRSLDNAVEFRAWSDKRVIEHAPFSVWGIYITEELKGTGIID